MSTTADPSTWVALLRGINVGRNKRVRMADLRDALSAAGAGDVRTLLQSGNVVLTLEGSEPDVARVVHDAVLACSGHEVAVVVRTAPELAAVVAASPMPDPPDGARFFVAFLEGRAVDVDLPQLPEGSGEQWWRGQREVYVWCPDGLMQSPVMGHFAGRGAALATVRNWNTVTALGRLVGS